MTGLCSDQASRSASRSFGLRYAVRAPLALVAVAAFASSAVAAGHRAPLPLHRALAVQPVHTARTAPSAHTVRESTSNHSLTKSHAADRRSPEAGSAGASRGSRAVVYTAAVHGREAVAHGRDAGRPGSIRAGLGGRSQGGRSQAAFAAPGPVRAAKPGSLSLPNGHKLAPPAPPVQEETEAVADRRTSARIHAWYSRQNTSVPAAEQTRNTRPSAAISSTALASVTPAATIAPAVTRKAAALDAARGAAAQSNASLAAEEQKEHQTTAADDNANAESHIPSTAPTERVPSPFIHGDGLQSSGTVPSPANHSRIDGAPVVRQQQGGSPVSQPGRGLPPPPQTAAHLSVSPVTSLVPQRADLRGNLATASTATPNGTVLVSPALISPALTKAAPAASAVQANARKPKLDAAVAAGMAEENFDEDGTPATARTAVALAAAGASAANRRTVSALQASDQSLPALAAVNVNLYDSSGHLMVMAPMKGSHEILVHQNQMALQDGLVRVQDDSQLAEMRRQQMLVALPNDDTIYPNDVLPLNRRYARSWTVRFLRDMGRAHYTKFGTPLIVTSAVRTVAFQRHLVRVNANAAPPTGDIASPHLYGQAVDIGKRGMSLTELTWMRAYLTPVENDGKIDVEEEFQQACFHISVYRKYLGTQDKLPQRLQVPTLLQAKAAPTMEAVPEPKQQGGKRRLPTALLATGLR